MLSANEIMEYEIGKSGLLKTYFMRLFPAYSKRIIRKNIRRYRKFMNRESVPVT
jgi:hypothetical protein